jgi:predicted Zn-dependent protease with MMP-like domain
MTLDECRACVSRLLDSLPESTHDALEDVVVHVVDAPADPHPPDARAVFDGIPATEADDEENEQAMPAAGNIVLFAANLPTEDSVRKALLHEIEHAMGGDEIDAELMENT